MARQAEFLADGHEGMPMLAFAHAVKDRQLGHALGKADVAGDLGTFAYEVQNFTVQLIDSASQRSEDERSIRNGRGHVCLSPVGARHARPYELVSSPSQGRTLPPSHIA